MLFYYHYNLIHFYRLKSLAPPREYSGYEYELYHVRKQQNASNRRPVGLRPAGRFLSIFADCHFRQKSDGKGGGQQTKASIGP